MNANAQPAQRPARRQLRDSSVSEVLVFFSIFAFVVTVFVFGSAVITHIRLKPFRDNVLNFPKVENEANEPLLNTDEEKQLRILESLNMLLIVECIALIHLCFFNCIIQSQRRSVVIFFTLTMVVLIVLQLVLMIFVQDIGKAVVIRYVIRIAQRTVSGNNEDAHHYCTMFADIQYNYRCCGVDGTSLLLQSSMKAEICGIGSGGIRQQLYRTCAEAYDYPWTSTRMSCIDTMWNNFGSVLSTIFFSETIFLFFVFDVVLITLFAVVLLCAVMDY